MSQMRQLTQKKKPKDCLNSVAITLLFLAGCCPIESAPPPPQVQCHQWSKDEKLAHYKEDIALNPGNSLHDIIKDYERVCLTLK